jgi:hypothetical protein
MPFFSGLKGPCTMVRKALFVAIASASLFIFQSPTFALSSFPCSNSFLANFKDQLKDGQLYYFTGAKWTQVLPADYHSLPPGQYNFTYVILEFLPGGRAGVLVIKSGRYQTDRPVENGQSVLMIRTDSKFTKTKQCPRPTARFDLSGERVSATSYDGYHDYGYQGNPADMEKIDRFHVDYENASQQCLETDRSRSDKTFPGFWRSNRSQFSFNDGIVDGGMGWQIADAGRNLIGRSYAAYEKFTQRQVEIRRYETDGQQPACLAVRVSLSGPNHFLSINDLENWSGGFRGPESRWNHQD